MNINVILAIFKRNLSAYFSSPIGYVFICAFVLLSAVAAFWPNEFFNANLANLNQLNKALPWIMLVIVPAITMSIWADERRQGTDELLLTLPATDLDVVIGKYLSALAIFTIALLFSIVNIAVLRQLGRPDTGLLAANYFGYWVVGAGMLAIGMAASFLSGNLTVSFILAVAMNAPLAFAASADAILPREIAIAVSELSIQEQFRDFARGVITLKSIVFFGSVCVVMLYLCMVLIGRRHWSGRKAGGPMALHFAVRLVAVAAIAFGVNAAAARFGARLDVSSERLSSLHSDTREILGHLDASRPVIIEAYISPEVPEEYVQTRLNLLSVLREVDAIGGDNVIVRVTNTVKYSAEAAEAEDNFGIMAQSVQAQQRGAMTVQDIHLGAAFLCGLEKVVVPFFDKGIPAEYEVIRSIATVSAQKRKKIGVVTTDVKLFGGFDMQNFSQRRDEKLVDELKKQYDVTQVNPASPIGEGFDALLIAQPSSLPAPQLENVVAAVARGIPAAIFEDPFPFFDPSVPSTSQPRTPGGNPFQQRQMPEPKGDVSTLFAVLGVDFSARRMVWQDYNPHPKVGQFPNEFVFIDRSLRRAVESESSGATSKQGGDVPAEETRAGAFNLSSPITRDLQEMLFVFPGEFAAVAGSTLQFTPLVRTGTRTGFVNYDDAITRNFLGGASLNPQRRVTPTDESYVLAARIQASTVAGAPIADPAASSPESEAAMASSRGVNAVLVSDIDVLYSVFFDLRQRGTEEGAPVELNLDNVSFVLDVLDSLAGDTRFLAIRNRRPAHRTLTAVELRTEAARRTATTERNRFAQEFQDKQNQEQEKLDRRIEELKNRPNIDPRQMMLEIDTAQQIGQNRLNATVEKLQRERDRAMQKIETDLAVQVGQVQHTYKMMAVALPPIPPLALAIAVFLRRRRMEQVGVPTRRLRGAKAS